MTEENAFLTDSSLLHKNYILDKFFLFNKLKFTYFKANETSLKQLEFFPRVGVKIGKIEIMPFASFGHRHFEINAYSVTSYFSYPKQKK